MNRIKVDLGYPWGKVEFPRGYIVRESPAACEASSHEGHPFCSPGWEENLPPGAILLVPPICAGGWVALIAEPASPAVGGERYAHVAGGEKYGLLDSDDAPLLAPPTDDYAWDCTICGKAVYYAYGEGMTDFVEDSQGVMCLEHTKIIWPPESPDESTP